MHFSVFNPFLKRYRPSLSVAMLLMICEVSVELCSPLILAHIIDAGIVPRDLNTILLWGGILLMLALFSFVCGITNTFFAADAAQGIVHDLRSTMFRKLMACDVTQRNRYATGSIVTRMTGDMNQIHNAIFLLLRIYLRAPFLIVGCTVLALMVDWQLALMLVVAAPLSITLLVLVIRASTRRFGEVQKRVDHINRLLSENIVGMRMIRSFDRGSHEAQRFDVANQDLQQEATMALRLPEVTMPILLLIMNLSVLAVIWLGESRIIENDLQVGVVLAILNYAVRVSVAYSFVGMIVSNLTMAYAASKRTAEILALPPSSQATHIDDDNQVVRSERATPAVQLDQVSYHYPGIAEAALQDISFLVPAGQTIAIVGLTGAGKSTLLRLIAGLIEPSTGTIRFDDTPRATHADRSVPRLTALAAQEPLLFSGSIQDNLLWGNPDATEEEIEQAAITAHIHHAILTLPGQYDFAVEQRGKNLSGGQRQRLAIARALIGKPRVLLLDDCTSALDAKTEQALLQSLREQACTTFLVTQKTSTAEHADLILVLSEGRMVASGSHATLLQQSALYRQIHDSQQAKNQDSQESHVN